MREFYGSFKISPKPDKEITTYINKFNKTRRMKRRLDGLYGTDGEFYIHDDKCGIVDFSAAPGDQPGLWCQWLISGSDLMWDGGEKFYNPTLWLNYMISKFFKPHGYTLNGVIKVNEYEEEYFYIIVRENTIYEIEQSIQNKDIDIEIAKRLLNGSAKYTDFKSKKELKVGINTLILEPTEEEKLSFKLLLLL